MSSDGARRGGEHKEEGSSWGPGLGEQEGPQSRTTGPGQMQTASQTTHLSFWAKENRVGSGEVLGRLEKANPGTTGSQVSIGAPS